MTTAIGDGRVHMGMTRAAMEVLGAKLRRMHCFLKTELRDEDTGNSMFSISSRCRPCGWCSAASAN